MDKIEWLWFGSFIALSSYASFRMGRISVLREQVNDLEEKTLKAEEREREWRRSMDKRLDKIEKELDKS